jgi:hypothetical protein
MAKNKMLELKELTKMGIMKNKKFQQILLNTEKHMKTEEYFL